MDKNKQKMRYTDAELSLIKNTFADNEEVLKTIRKVFLQIPLDVIDQQTVEGLKSRNVLELLRKSFLPEIDANAPIHQVVDLWMTLEIKGKSPEMVAIDAMARKKLITYLDEQLKKLEGGEKLGGIVFEDLANIDGKEVEDIYIDLIVRNTIIGHTEMQLASFVVLAGTKEETVEQTVKRLAKDSAK